MILSLPVYARAMRTAPDVALLPPHIKGDNFRRRDRIDQKLCDLDLQRMGKGVDGFRRHLGASGFPYSGLIMAQNDRFEPHQVIEIDVTFDVGESRTGLGIHIIRVSQLTHDVELTVGLAGQGLNLVRTPKCRLLFLSHGLPPRANLTQILRNRKGFWCDALLRIISTAPMLDIADRLYSREYKDILLARRCAVSRMTLASSTKWERDISRLGFVPADAVRAWRLMALPSTLSSIH